MSEQLTALAPQPAYPASDRRGVAPLADQAWVLYMVGLSVRDDGVPHDWREAHRHPDMARSALLAALGPLRDLGVAL